MWTNLADVIQIRASNIGRIQAEFTNSDRHTGMCTRFPPRPVQHPDEV